MVALFTYLTPLLTSRPILPPLPVDHRPVEHQGRQVRVRRHPAVRHQRRPPPALLPFRSLSGNTRAVPRPARVHALDQLPAVSRFWPFQWIEGGWLLALSLLLITATIWLVRRRAA